MTEILIVEDEPLLCYAYRNILKDLEKEEDIGPFHILECNTYDSTLNLLDKKFQKNKGLDLCLLDYRLGSKNNDNENGLTIGFKIRQVYPKCKIVVITSISDNYLFNSIFENLNPSSFLIKTDLDYAGIKKKLQLILNGSRVYSQEVNDFLMRRDKLLINKIDKRDLKIIRLMDQGLSLPEIGKKIGLSLSGIENRKRIIAERIGAPSPSKKELLKFAKEELNLI
ncbi:response regulator [Muricauda sp. SCSIO 64092]|uniref:response regulator transcription factor n=1 Tax=Allomuricauda sp. SCSIO 64092 TaxID=2908842 RepID=UPI001FF13485|nr:response regulator [Muricauda sp. SCSIO 64092]UOY06041.1 response regulator [Muricauda sp. SCSIO 64092]